MPQIVLYSLLYAIVRLLLEARRPQPQDSRVDGIATIRRPAEEGAQAAMRGVDRLRPERPPVTR